MIRKGIESLAFEASLRHVLVEDGAMYALCSYSPHLAKHFKMRIKKKVSFYFGIGRLGLKLLEAPPLTSRIARFTNSWASFCMYVFL